MALQWRYNGVTMALQWRYNGVTMALQWRFNRFETVLKRVGLSYRHQIRLTPPSLCPLGPAASPQSGWWCG